MAEPIDHPSLSFRVHVHSDADADKMWQQLQLEQNNVQRTVRLLDRICTILLEHVFNHIGRSTSIKNVIPVHVLRGGLIMLNAYHHIRPYSRCGLIVPYRLTPNAAPSIVYGDVPQLEPNGKYLLLDLIINTGATICACLDSIQKTTSRVDEYMAPMLIVSPFLTELATETILGQFPDVQIHTIWHRMVRGRDGRLIGLGFDGGDYACGDGLRISLI